MDHGLGVGMIECAAKLQNYGPQIGPCEYGGSALQSKGMQAGAFYKFHN